MFSMKTLTKVPMAAIGLIDLIACGADKAICKLAKRGEKAVRHMKQKSQERSHCCACDDESICENS